MMQHHIHTYDHIQHNLHICVYMYILVSISISMIIVTTIIVIITSSSSSGSIVTDVTTRNKCTGCGRHVHLRARH